MRKKKSEWKPDLDFLEFIKKDGAKNKSIVVGGRELSWEEFVEEMKKGVSEVRALYNKLYEDPHIKARYEAWKKKKKAKWKPDKALIKILEQMEIRGAPMMLEGKRVLDEIKKGTEQGKRFQEFLSNLFYTTLKGWEKDPKKDR